MSNEKQSTKTRNVKKIRNRGIVLVGLCVAACKLPFLLFFLGFGGVGATASMMDISPTVKAIAVAISLLGIAALIAYYFYRRFRRAVI